MIRDYFRFSYESIRKRKLRSYLTMIGIFIGIAAVVSLISLGQGLQSAIDEQFKGVGSDKIIVSPGGGFGPPGASASKLTEEDKKVIERVKGVDVVAGATIKFVDVHFKSESKYLAVMGMPLDEKEKKVLMESAHNMKIISGRELDSGDGSSAIVGYAFTQKNTLFSTAASVRDTIALDGKNFKIVGVAAKVGNPSDDGAVFIPIDVSQEMFGVTNEFDYFYVRIESGENVTKVANSIEEAMRKDRHLKVGEEDFSVQTFESILNIFNTIFIIH